MMYYWLFIFNIIVFSFADSVHKSEVIGQVNQVDNLRNNLVKGVSLQPTMNTFKAVCSPVGLNIKSIKKEYGFLIRQASHKNRNPNNQANPMELAAIKKMQKSDRKSFWLDKGDKQHYFQKIVVKKDCLACHGPQNKRPDFIKKKYPQDKAFGFQEGDLRGVYHVVIDKK